MRYRLLSVFLLSLPLCLTCAGQTSYKGLTPGQSTRADVERALGQPVKELSETLLEYAPPGGAGQVFVQYRRGAAVVERVVFIYPEAVSRADALRSLGLPPRADASQVNERGKFEEYFAAGSLVLTYDGAEAGDGVARVGYYSRELFESEFGKVSRPSESGGGGGARAGLLPPMPDIPDYMTGGPNSSTARAGRSPTSARPDAARPAERTTDAPRPSPRTGGSASAASPQAGGDGAGGLRRFVGRYVFDDDDPSFGEARVTLAGDTLRLTLGETGYTLVPAPAKDLVTEGPGAGGTFSVGGNAAQFRLAGRPGLRIIFSLEGGRARNLTYFDERTNSIRVAERAPTP